MVSDQNVNTAGTDNQYAQAERESYNTYDDANDEFMVAKEIVAVAYEFANAKRAAYKSATAIMLEADQAYDAARDNCDAARDAVEFAAKEMIVRRDSFSLSDPG
jgi:hypothetical protein